MALTFEEVLQRLSWLESAHPNVNPFGFVEGVISEERGGRRSFIGIPVNLAAFRVREDDRLEISVPENENIIRVSPPEIVCVNVLSESRVKMTFGRFPYEVPAETLMESVRDHLRVASYGLSSYLYYQILDRSLGFMGVVTGMIKQIAAETFAREVSSDKWMVIVKDSKLLGEQKFNVAVYLPNHGRVGLDLVMKYAGIQPHVYEDFYSNVVFKAKCLKDIPWQRYANTAGQTLRVIRYQDEEQSPIGVALEEELMFAPRK